jgi:hypothetical protein
MVLMCKILIRIGQTIKKVILQISIGHKYVIKKVILQISIGHKYVIKKVILQISIGHKYVKASLLMKRITKEEKVSVLNLFILN